jgi:nucleoside-diphosphate-sugar epimerase
MAVPEAAGGRFLAVGDGGTLSFLELADMLRELLGPLAARVPVEEAPGEEPPRLVIRNDRAREVLGWRPRPLGETVMESVESLRGLGLVKLAGTAQAAP